MQIEENPIARTYSSFMAKKETPPPVIENDIETAINANEVVIPVGESVITSDIHSLAA